MAARRSRGEMWPAALALYAAAGGLVSLAGWIFDRPRLADWFSSGYSIQPNTCIATICAGLAVIALEARLRRVTLVFGAAVLSIGAVSLAEHIARRPLGGVDQWLMFGRAWGAAGVVHPGRMGPPAAVSWLLLGVALVLTSAVDRLDRRRSIVPALASVTTMIASLSLIGYFYGATVLYAIPSATAISLQTSTFIFALSLSVMFSLREFGPARIIREDTSSGAMFRRTLPALVIVPIVLGFLRLAGERAGYYDLAFGTAGRTLVEICLLIGLLWLVARDVSVVEERRRDVEDLLVERERMLRTVTEEAQVGLVIVGPDHRYIYANRAYCDIVHVDAAFIVGRHVRDVLPEAYEWRIKPKLDLAFSGETVPYELELPERHQFVQVTYQPQMRDGVVSTVLVAIVDTTERRLVEDALHRTQTHLEEEARRKDRFLMTLAHELRNPLAPIRTAIELLNRPATDAQAAWARGIVERQMKQLVRLLDDLLDVSRIARDKLTLRLERVDLRAIVREAAEAASSGERAPIKQALSMQLPPAPLEVRADPARLAQIVSNLLNNAGRCTPPDGRIEISLSQESGDAVIRVIDSGIGIAADDLTRIFEMFSQVERPGDHAPGGLGIGLHLVKRLVELHGGSVEARSGGAECGSEFIVRVPVQTAAAAPHTIPAAPPPAARRAALRLLVVDDNTDAADMLAMLLRAEGHEARVAQDGASAIAAADAHQPDVILLDIGLPDRDGYDVARAIRQSSRLTQAWTPLIVALTGWGQESDREKSRAAGIDHHMVKPVEYEALAALLSAHNDRRSPRALR